MLRLLEELPVLRLTEEVPVPRRTTSSLRVLDADDAEPVRPVTTRTEELRLEPLSIRRVAPSEVRVADAVPVRVAPVATEPREAISLVPRREEATSEVR